MANASGLKREGRGLRALPGHAKPRNRHAAMFPAPAGNIALDLPWRRRAERTLRRVKPRVGLFADSVLQPRWLVEALAKVVASELVEVVALAHGGTKPSQQPWLWRMYGRIDRRLFGSGPDPSERVDIRSALSRVRLLSMPQPGAQEAAVAGWRSELARLRLDVAFALGDIDDAALDGVARYGVWRYCFGPHRDAVEPLAGIRETADAAPLTITALKARRGGVERLIYQSWGRTYPFSVARNREKALRKSTEFAVRALKRLRLSGGRWFERCPTLDDDAPAARGGLGAAESLRTVSRLGARVAWRALQKLACVEQWFLGYRFGGEARWPGDLCGFTRLMPPKDRFWADPFPLERNGRYFIFFEEFMFATGKAHIAMVELDRNGGCSAPSRVLERDYHLSYPFLIEVEGELYMVPETLENRCVELYRCVDFPLRWRLERVLIRDILCADATVYHGNGRWWMLANVGVEGGEAHDELHIFFSDCLHGDWQPHRRNPVKSDVRSARPAGKLFLRNGALYRPAQICAPLYGSGVSINRVLHLSPQAYVEREEERIAPPPHSGLLGIHTLNRSGELSVLDGFVRRLRI